jgi:CHAT domain/SPOR domain
LLRREDASETALKQVSGPRILHIATHGFFIEDQEPASSASPGAIRSGLAEAKSYTVQVESTPELETARESVERLREQGLDAYVIKSKVKGKGYFFRVRSGNFATQGEAQKHGAELRAKGVAGKFYVARYKPPQGELAEPGLATAEVATKPVTASTEPLSETFSRLRLGRFTAQVKNPLLRSGLALSGANEGKSGADDGLLTALEVAGLDLWGTKLAVLSACDTGLGEIKRGEGVQGLRRALVLAGSESQVISLWAIPDKLGKEIITPYYQALRRGEGRAEGLRQVQLQMLRSRDRRHPFYWAAFIQSGEWANLDGRR